MLQPNIANVMVSIFQEFGNKYVILKPMVETFKGSKVHFKVQGQGPALVLLHGFMEDLTMWDAFIPELSSRYKVLRIDLLGHGKTPCIGKIHSMELMAESVFKILKILKIKKAMFIGHSMGGYVALALSGMYQDSVSDLILLNSTFEADSEDRKHLREKAIEQAQENKLAYKKLIRISFANLFSPESIETCSTEFKKAMKVALKLSLWGYTAALEGMKLRPNRWKVLKNIEGRRIILLGRKDSLIDVKNMREKIEGSTVELIEFSEGHMSHIENKSDLSYFFKHLIEK